MEEFKARQARIARETRRWQIADAVMRVVFFLWAALLAAIAASFAFGLVWLAQESVDGAILAGFVASVVAVLAWAFWTERDMDRVSMALAAYGALFGLLVFPWLNF
jgi:hypothetical protein